MASNYRKLGSLIKIVDIKNKDNKVTNLMGVSTSKCFMPSVANVIGTDLSKYKVIEKNQFACSLMQVSRDNAVAMSRWSFDEKAIMSPAYDMFEVIDNGFDTQKLLYVSDDINETLYTRDELLEEAFGITEELNQEINVPDICDD